MSKCVPHHNLAQLKIVLFEPEIPPNTGNIIRLCANTGSELHIIRPMAFQLDDKRLRRAGLDYAEWENIKLHDHWEAFIKTCQPQRLFAISTKGKQWVHQQTFQPDDWMVFGPESRGLPNDILSSLNSENILRIPMQPNSRSINLANAVSVVMYEHWRQLDFTGAI